LGSHLVYIRGIYKIKSFASKGVTRHALWDKWFNFMYSTRWDPKACI